MSYGGKSYLEHTAFYVRDINWHIKFFKEVLGVEIRFVQGDEKNPAQAWLLGGFQLVSKPDFNAPEGRLAHLGVMTENLEEALELAYAHGVTAMEQGRNWIRLPDGLCIEVMQAPGNLVRDNLDLIPKKTSL